MQNVIIGVDEAENIYLADKNSLTILGSKRMGFGAEVNLMADEDYQTVLVYSKNDFSTVALSEKRLEFSLTLPLLVICVLIISFLLQRDREINAAAVYNKK